MPPEIKEVDRPILAVSATWTGDLRCPLCDSDLRYAYPGVERIVEDLHQVIKLRQHYYLCSNTDCSLHKAFHAPHNIVLPHKKYSRKVYEKVIRLYHEVGNNPSKIKKTLDIFNCALPSKKTIRRYIEEYELLKSYVIDSTLEERIKSNGELYIIVDGQRPKRGHPSLWSFLELLTGEHIHAEFLKTADEQTLGEIFLRIEQKFGCKIKAVISDHQSSIVNAVKTYLPHAKHQFCHFHFLKNLADPLQKMDSHLLSTLESGINRLYINTATTSKRIQMAPGVYEQIQDFFSPLFSDLKAQIAYPSRTFDTWGSIESYESLTDYSDRLHKELLPLVPKTSRIGKLLHKDHQRITTLLSNTSEFYNKLRVLIPKFDEIRDILGMKVFTKKGMKREAERWMRSLKNYVEKSETLVGLDEPITALSYRASIERVYVLWYRLYRSHRRGLFEFLGDPHIPRTNTELEREYSKELGFWRTMSGRGNVNYYVHIKGDIWLKKHRSYCPEEIQDVLDMYSLCVVNEGKEVLRARRLEERSTWRGRKPDNEGMEEMKKKIKKIYEKSRLLSS